MRYTKQRSITVEDSIWFPALRRAREEGYNLSKVIRRLLEMWLAGQIRPFIK